MLEGPQAREAVATEARRTVSRRDLARRERFEQVSPEVGVLDADAFDDLLSEDLDAALSMLVDMTGATDDALRRLAERLAARVVVDLATRGGARGGGIGSLRRVPLDRGDGDVDVDASLDGLVARRRGARPASGDDLFVNAWQRPDTAWCLLVDRSGSMHGQRLATAAVVAAAVASRAGRDRGVVAFGTDALVLASPHDGRLPAEVVLDLCRLRGTGVTDLALAFRVAGELLSRSTARRRVTVLLSDCRATTGNDPVQAARALDELVVLCPAEDSEDAAALADALAVPWAPVAGPSSAIDALTTATTLTSG